MAEAEERPEVRVRENRTHGSEGGEGPNPSRPRSSRLFYAPSDGDF